LGRQEHDDKRDIAALSRAQGYNTLRRERL
jgi:hypothetical protein